MLRKIVISNAEIIPSFQAILRAQGAPIERVNDSKISDLLNQAIILFGRNAAPTGIISEISKDDFSHLFYGEGKNSEDAPLEKIYKSADYLALFAITLGEKICQKISALFDEREFALAAMLDSAASEGTENAAAFMENSYRRFLKDNYKFDSSSATLRFSPGYCGWDISGQRELFDCLRPEEIGISLLGNFLMQPLKSISGVIVAGRREIFDFDDDLSFCNGCKTHSCRVRVKEIREENY